MPSAHWEAARYWAWFRTVQVSCIVPPTTTAAGAMGASGRTSSGANSVMGNGAKTLFDSLVSPWPSNASVLINRYFGPVPRLCGTVTVTERVYVPPTFRVLGRGKNSLTRTADESKVGLLDR